MILLYQKTQKSQHKKKKDLSQVTSGSTVPSVLNDPSFFGDNIYPKEPFVNSKKKKVPPRKPHTAGYPPRNPKQDFLKVASQRSGGIQSAIAVKRSPFANSIPQNGEKSTLKKKSARNKKPSYCGAICFKRSHCKYSAFSSVSSVEQPRTMGTSATDVRPIPGFRP